MPSSRFPCCTQSLITVAILATQPLYADTAPPQSEPPQSTDPVTLPVVVIKANSPSSVVRRLSSATRTETPVREIPQSVVVINRDLIVDQGAQSVSDALRNASNVNAIDTRDSNNAVFRIRGFTSATVVDGVTMPGYFPNQESLVNLEQIDVLKGPAGALFGSAQGMGTFASLGGTVAMTTSQAQLGDASRMIGMQVGSFGERGASFNLNQPLNSSFAVRLAGEVLRSDSETEQVFFKRTALFPSLTWKPNTDSEFVVRLRKLNNTTLDYSGLPPYGTIIDAGSTIPRNRLVTANGLPDTTHESEGVNLQWNQLLNQHWKFSLIAAYNQVAIDQRGVFTFPFGGTGPGHLLAGARLWDEWKSTVISPSLTAELQTGEIKHTLNLGLDYEKTRDDAYMVFSNGSGLLSMTPVDLSNPVNPDWIEPIPPATADEMQRNRYTATVAYVQDQLTIGSWHLLGSLRHSKIRVQDVNLPWFINNHSRNTATTPRLGAVYDFSSVLSGFAGYSEGIKVPTGAVFAVAPKLETARQKEIGLRLTQWNGVTASLAWFELTRNNSIIADIANPGFSLQAGEQQSKGIDFDLRWQVSPAWSWLAAATVQEATISEDSNPQLLNKQLFNVPEKTLRLATRYTFTKGSFSGMGLGLGLTYNSRLPGDQQNNYFTPAATVWDAQVAYPLKEARLGLNIHNLFDKQYYAPSAYFGGGQVIPAQPRTITATASYSF